MRYCANATPALPNPATNRTKTIKILFVLRIFLNSSKVPKFEPDIDPRDSSGIWGNVKESGRSSGPAGPRSKR
jgi:hypothetical protein